jgi:FkbM family methyltransferase
MRDGVVLDIGTNIGNHTLYFANECMAKKIISFEPAQDTFAMLQENIKINHLENVVTLINKGVGEKSTRARIHYRNINDIGATSLEWDEGAVWR